VVSLNRAVAAAMVHGPAADRTASIPERDYLIGRAVRLAAETQGHERPEGATPR